jgi:hypothetical protein
MSCLDGFSKGRSQLLLHMVFGLKQLKIKKCVDVSVVAIVG